MRSATAGRALPFTLCAFALVALYGHGTLLLGLPLQGIALPILLLLAAKLAPPRLPQLAWPVCVALTAAVGVITWGCLAGAPRIWDGFTAWNHSARWLAMDGTLEQPFFRDPAVFATNRSYPLLQPLAQAQLLMLFGSPWHRLLFPVLWLATTVTVAKTLAAVDLRGWCRNLMVVGFALLPAFVEPREGSAESGYGELIVCFALTHAAAGTLTRRPLQVAAAALLLPLTKTEGSPFAIALVAALALCSCRRLAIGAALGATIGLLLWLPLYEGLKHASGPSLAGLPFSFAPLVVLLVFTLISERRWRWLGITLAIAVALAFLFGTQGRPSISRAIDLHALHLAALPQCLGRMLVECVQPNKVGLTFVLPMIAIFLAMRRGLLCREHLAAILTGLSGAALLLLFLLCLPSESLQSFLHTGVDRYVSQWCGASWLIGGALLASLQTPAASLAGRSGG